MKRFILTSASLCGLLFATISNAYAHPDAQFHSGHHKKQYHSHAPKRHHHKRDKHRRHHYSTHQTNHYHYNEFRKQGCRDVSLGVHIGPHVTISAPRRHCHVYPKPRIVVHSRGYQW